MNREGPGNQSFDELPPAGAEAGADAGDELAAGALSVLAGAFASDAAEEESVEDELLFDA